MPRVYAAADIGSNTAHVLVAASDGELVMRVDNYNEWIPLGEVVARQGSIPKEIVEELIIAMRGIRKTALDKKADCLYVFATEAMRSAANHKQVLKKIKDDTGIDIDIVAPRREAELSLRGSMLDCRHLGMDVMIEVGGGSAQLAVVTKNRLHQEESLPLGTGRVIAEANLASPCPDYAMVAAENYITTTIENSKVDHQAKMAVASGGVVRGLWRAIHPDGEKFLELEEIDYVIWAVSRLTIDRIVSRFGVKPKRAGTLLPGALVYRALMRKLAVRHLIISEFGVREGAVLEMANGKVKGCAL